MGKRCAWHVRCPAPCPTAETTRARTRIARQRAPDFASMAPPCLPSPDSTGTRPRARCPSDMGSCCHGTGRSVGPTGRTMLVCSALDVESKAPRDTPRAALSSVETAASRVPARRLHCAPRPGHRDPTNVRAPVASPAHQPWEDGESSDVKPCRLREQFPGHPPRRLVPRPITASTLAIDGRRQATANQTPPPLRSTSPRRNTAHRVPVEA